MKSNYSYGWHDSRDMYGALAVSLGEPTDVEITSVFGMTARRTALRAAITNIPRALYDALKRKRMAKKVSYLETSPEKFQQQDGNGSSPTGSITPTGSRTAAILQPKTDSSSPTETQSKHPLDVTWGDAVKADLQQMLEESGKPLESGSSLETNLDLLLFWQTRIPVRQKG